MHLVILRDRDCLASAFPLVVFLILTAAFLFVALIEVRLPCCGFPVWEKQRIELQSLNMQNRAGGRCEALIEDSQVHRISSLDFSFIFSPL